MAITGQYCTYFTGSEAVWLSASVFALWKEKTGVELMIIYSRIGAKPDLAIYAGVKV